MCVCVCVCARARVCVYLFTKIVFSVLFSQCYSYFFSISMIYVNRITVSKDVTTTNTTTDNNNE